MASSNKGKSVDTKVSEATKVVDTKVVDTKVDTKVDTEPKVGTVIGGPESSIKAKEKNNKKVNKDTAPIPIPDKNTTRSSTSSETKKDKGKKEASTTPASGPTCTDRYQKYKDDKETKYCILMETNGEEHESWYYFLKYNGNERAMKHLSDQISSIDFYVMDDETNCFDIDIVNLVSAITAKELCKVLLNSVTFHRKFDGKLRTIDFGFKRRDDNEDKIIKVNNKLAGGRIEKYINEEDLDPEDEISDEESHEEDSEEGSEEEGSE